MAIVMQYRGAAFLFGTSLRNVRYLSYSMAVSRCVTVESRGLGVRHI